MTELPRPSQLGPDATIEDLVRSARAHGIELPYSIQLPEDVENDPDMEPVTFRDQDGRESMSLHQRRANHPPTSELMACDNDYVMWRIHYQRVPDRFRVIYQETHRERLPEPTPEMEAASGAMAAELDALTREWRENDGLSELSRRRMRQFPFRPDRP